MAGGSGPSQVDQVNEQTQILTNALQGAYTAQANATREAAKIASETADKNRAVYTETNTQNQELLKGINTQNMDLLKGLNDSTISYLTQANAQSQQYLKPYMDAGQASLGNLEGLLGLQGQGKQQQLTQQYLASAPVQEALKMGQNAVETTAAAGGQQNSGRTLEELFKKGQQIATLGISDYQQQLMGLTDIGKQAAMQASNIAGQNASAIAQSNAQYGASATQTNNAYGQQSSALNQQTGQLVSGANQYEGESNANAQLALGQLSSENILGQAQVRLDHNQAMIKAKAADGAGGFSSILNGLGGSLAGTLLAAAPEVLGSMVAL